MRRWGPTIACSLSWLVGGCHSLREPVPPRVEIVYGFGSSDNGDADAGRRAPVAVDVLIRDGWGTTLFGVESDGIYYSKGETLYRMPLSDARAEPFPGIGFEGARALTTDHGEVIWTTDDCEIMSSVHHHLRGACLAAPHTLFVDGQTLYILAEEQHEWRSPEMTLWRMPRRRAVAQKIATLPDFTRVSGASRGLFDGSFFYYMDTFGKIFRVSKDDGSRELFAVATFGADELEFVDQNALYFSTEGRLVRAPTDGSGPPVAFAEVRDDHFARDATHAYLATPDALYMAPSEGGEWRWIAELPNGAWQVRPVGDRVYLWDRDHVLVVKPKGPRPRRLLALDDEPIVSLAWTPRGLYFTKDDNDVVTQESANAVWLLPAQGGSPHLVFRDQMFTAAPAFDERNAYVRVLDGSVRRHSLDDGEAETFVSPQDVAAALGVPLPTEDERRQASYTALDETERLRTLFVDETSVYWLDASAPVLLRAAKSDGKPRVFATLPGRVEDVDQDAAFVYVIHDKTSPPRVRWTSVLRRIAKAHPDRNDVLAESDGLSLARTEEVTVWETDDRLFGLSSAGGFTELGGLILLPERETARFGTQGLMGAGSDLFFIQTGDNDESVQLIRRGLDGRYTILGSGYVQPIALTAGPGTLYFVDAGRPAHPLSSGRRRYGCCSIWAVDR